MKTKNLNKIAMLMVNEAIRLILKAGYIGKAKDENDILSLV